MAFRNVLIRRGPTSFGITLSGHHPCVLSRVDKSSDAYRAGLRVGDCLLKVNNVSVQNAEHADVVNFIAGCGPSAMLSILPGPESSLVATNGSTMEPSSSGEDEDTIQNRAHYIVEQVQSKRLHGEPEGTNSSAELVNILFNRNRSSNDSGFHQHRAALAPTENTGYLRVVVSYLGSVSCSTEEWAQTLLGRAIVQLKDQQRVLVSMQATADALILTNHRGTAVARFTQDRIVFYAIDEVQSAYFGVVTRQNARQMSAHVFVTDSRLVPHSSHARRARTFKIACQRDPKSNTCKEFPSTAHPIMMALAKIRACPVPAAPRNLYDSDSGFRDDSLERSTNSGHLGRQLLGSSLEEVSAGLRDLIVLEKSPKSIQGETSLKDASDVMGRQYKSPPAMVYSLRKQHSLDALNSSRPNANNANGNNANGNHRRQYSGLSAHEPLQSQSPSVASWSESLEAVLNDPEGILIFAKFLKKEFAQENIFFWTACEKYRGETSQSQRKALANDIFNKHLRDESPEPVNIDSTTLRNISRLMEAGIAPKDMFAAAQSHIFNLMRMDCYPRFLRSELYQQCLIKSLNGEPLLSSPIKPVPPAVVVPPVQAAVIVPPSVPPSVPPKQQAQVASRTEALSGVWLPQETISTTSTTITTSTVNISSGSSLSSVSTSGGSIAKARRSLFPHVKKLTRKKKDAEKKDAEKKDAEKKDAEKKDAERKDAERRDVDMANEPNQIRKHSINVVTPLGELKQVPVIGTEVLAAVISEVLQSVSKGTSLVDVFIAQNKAPVNLRTPVSQFLNETITIEPRAAFLIALPSGMIVGIKCAPAVPLVCVMQDVSIRYGFDPSRVACRLDNVTKLLDPQTPCGQLDGKQLVLAGKTQRYGGLVSSWYSQGQDFQTFLDQVQAGAVIFDEYGYALFSSAAPPLPPKPVKFKRAQQQQQQHHHQQQQQQHPLESVCNISFV